MAESIIRKEEERRKLQLHYWHVFERDIDGEIHKFAYGIVTGHNRFSDATDITTSSIQSLYVDEEAEELLVTTKNSVYHCPLEYCLFQEQDNHPNMIPDYEKIKEKYNEKIDYPSIEPGKVLLVLSNFCEFYFHSLYYVSKDSEDDKPVDYTGKPHVGSYQDSFLARTKGYGIDLRYFPHYQNVEFYLENTKENPLYLENIGDIVLYAKTSCGTIKLEPGDRKEVIKENTEADTPVLSGGDLYPAGLFE